VRGCCMVVCFFLSAVLTFLCCLLHVWTGLTDLLTRSFFFLFFLFFSFCLLTSFSFCVIFLSTIILCVIFWQFPFVNSLYFSLLLLLCHNLCYFFNSFLICYTYSYIFESTIIISFFGPVVFRGEIMGGETTCNSNELSH
jgi:hypothetical protein